MKKCCTLYLQRNLPEVTHDFIDNLLKFNKAHTDFYVIESGSDDNRLSKYTNKTFHANWKEAREKGLRTGRGFNYGLLKLKELNLDYEYIMLACGDTKLPQESVVKILIEEMEKNKKIGIISPIAYNWGSKVSAFLGKEITRANYHPVPHVCWMFRRECLDDIAMINNDYTYMKYLYDGTNFRAYACDAEIMMKAFNLDWMFTITSQTSLKEQSDLTDKNFKIMKTEPAKVHSDLMYSEGLKWLKSKYNFDNKHQMWNLLKKSYFDFFSRNPSTINLKQ